jgi:hypothetical protein
MYYGDAINIIKDYPFIGTGGGGWRVFYEKYQSESYTSRELHNQFLQICVDTGILGLISYLSLIFFGFLSLKKSITSVLNNKDRIVLAGIASVLAVLLLHSCIDFTMSLPSIAIIFWVLLGIIIYYDRKRDSRIFEIQFKIKSLFILFVFAINFITLTSLYLSTIFAQKARFCLEAGELYEAEKYSQVALFLFPFNEVFALEAAGIKLVKFKTSEDNRMKGEIVNLIDKSLKLGLYDLNRLIHAADIYISVGEFEKVRQTASFIIDNHPLKPRTYQETSRLLLKVAQEYEKNKEYTRVIDTCKQIKLILVKLKQINTKKLSEDKIEISQELIENLQQSQIMLDKLREYEKEE